MRAAYNLTAVFPLKWSGQNMARLNVTGVITALLTLWLALPVQANQQLSAPLKSLIEREAMGSIHAQAFDQKAQSSVLEQVGYGNHMYLLQQGTGNRIVALQHGVDLTANIIQVGTDNHVQLAQYGDGRQITVEQFGHRAAVLIEQY